MKYNIPPAPLLLYILFNIVHWPSYPQRCGLRSNRQEEVLTLGYALFALVALGFAYVSSTTSLIILFMLYGLVGAQSAFNLRHESISIAEHISWDLLWLCRNCILDFRRNFRGALAEPWAEDYLSLRSHCGGIG